MERGIAYVAFVYLFVFHAEDGIRDRNVTGVQTCALPICTINNNRRFIYILFCYNTAYISAILCNFFNFFIYIRCTLLFRLFHIAFHYCVCIYITIFS